ncbi:MAG: GGDEF domain-containing protein [Candidatus Omnitrophota bacterium]|nr:GGDEF domain-containing protein [Candidatus Omnitrophota bacterium]
MFRIKPIIVFGLNFALMLFSWIMHNFPRGDEYLALFMIPLIFIIVPFICELPVTGALVAVNLVFFIFYAIIGILDAVDIIVFMVVIGAIIGGCHIMKSLYTSFVMYYRFDILARQRGYNDIVGELEEINRLGRKEENELSRISRLYEITKKLAPALKFKELLDILFDFLEESFMSKTTHLLTFNNGSFVRGISKTSGDEKYSENKDTLLVYDKVVEYARETDFNPFFAERETNEDLFKRLNIGADTFMMVALFVGDKLSAVLAIEGISKTAYSRFSILIPQIALELRKVELYEQVQKLSIVDGLTEVYLRRYLMDRLEEEVDRASRLGLKFSIGMVDVDNFKECNDLHGHLVGDTVLKKISERLKCSVREVDMVARYGGEEFCIVLPETTKKLALTVAERLRNAVGVNEIDAFGKKIKTTVSIGISTFPKDGEDVNSLIEKADAALYRAKHKGKNVVCGA